MITEGHGRYFKTDFNSPVVNSLKCNPASGILKGLICDIFDYMDVCYKHASKYKCDIDDFVKVG